MRIPAIGELHRQGTDLWRAYELPLGVAVLVRLGLDPLLSVSLWLKLTVSLVLLAGAGGWGWRREQHLLEGDDLSALLSLPFWQAMCTAAILTLGLWYLAQHSGLSVSWRWQPMAMIAGLWLGAFWLTLGVFANRARHVYLGLWLCAVAALMPLVRDVWPRAIVGAIGIGGALLLSGWLGRRKG